MRPSLPALPSLLPALLAPPPRVMPEQVRELIARACPRAEVLEAWGEGELRFAVPPEEIVPAVMASLGDFDARLTTHVALPGRVVVTLSIGQLLVSFEAAVQDAVPSLTLALPAASWCEREARDHYGIEPLGHPDPRPLFRRADRAAAPEPDDLVSFTHGPLRNGLDDSVRVHFHNDGELVHGVEPRLFFNHRGAERLAEGRTADAALLLAERLCASCTTAQAQAFVAAVERGAGVAHEVPARAEALRTLAAELERMAVEVADLAALCEALGLYAAAGRTRLLEEELRQVCAEVTGSRRLYGWFVVGGVSRDLPTGARELARRLRGIVRRLVALWDDIDDAPAVLDRAEGMGALSRERALALGVVGVPARASRVPRDLRKDRPYAYYPMVDFKLALADAGDVLARAKVMVEEVREAVAIACQVLEGLPTGPLRIAVTPVAGRSALGWAESPHGETATWLEVGEGGRIARWRVRSGSYFNWPALATAMTTPIPDGTGRAPGNLVSDFPLVSSSFGLCVGCVDR